jgi:hypothetical protein
MQYEGALNSFKQAVGVAPAEDVSKADILRERSNCYTGARL